MPKAILSFFTMEARERIFPGDSFVQQGYWIKLWKVVVALTAIKLPLKDHYKSESTPWHLIATFESTGRLIEKRYHNLIRECYGLGSGMKIKLPRRALINLIISVSVLRDQETKCLYVVYIHIPCFNVMLLWNNTGGASKLGHMFPSTM